MLMEGEKQKFFLEISIPPVSLHQFFTITYQERQREMALRSLSNQPPFTRWARCYIHPDNIGKDKPSTKFTLRFCTIKRNSPGYQVSFFVLWQPINRPPVNWRPPFLLTFL